MDSLEPHIIRKISEEQALFFLGAGYAAAYGQKTTSGLCLRLREETEREAASHPPEKRDVATRALAQIAPTDLARLSEAYDFYHGADSAKKFIVALLKEVAVDLAQIGAIAELPMSTLVTTNFDDLIERAFDDKLDVCFRDDQLGPQTIRRTRLIKMHGSIGDYKSLVLKRDDYDRFKLERPQTCHVLRGQLVEKLPIVVGYSMDDTNFRGLVKELRAENWKTEIVVVQRNADPLTRAEWKNSGVIFIEADAREFLDSLNEEVRKYRKASRATVGRVADPKYASSVPEADHNPFKFFQTDKISFASVDIIRKYFIPVPEYAKIISPSSNTIIAGSRGSGKTMLLRYLSVEVQLVDFGPTRALPFVGFYIKCGAKLFSSMSCRGDGTCDDRKWVDFFTHVFNLAIVVRVCEILQLLQSLRVLSFEPSKERVFCSQLIGSVVRCAWRLGFDDPNFENAGKAIEDSFNSARAAPADRVEYALPLDFLHQLARLLAELHELFNGRPLFFLLDEMENLTSSQWRVVNSFLKDRDHPITFKVAAAAEGRPTRDANGQILKYEDDYTLVSTDKYSKDQSDNYLAFLRKVADRCLAEADCGIDSIDELLETRNYRTPSERLRFVGREFSGFKRYAFLSSGVVRTFVSLLKDTVAYAAPDIARRVIALKPISFQQQNAIVQVKSAIHRQAYLEAEHPDDVLTLVNALAQVFRLELQNSIDSCRAEIEAGGTFDYDHLRPISQVQIQSFSKLSARTKNALEQSLGVGLLQRPMDNRQPQQHSQVPHENFKIHRMLCPYYELALANRFPRKIEAELLNLVFQMGEADFAAKIAARHKHSQKSGGESVQALLEMAVAGDPEVNVAQEYDCDAE
jgi:SIR2-like domain